MPDGCKAKLSEIQDAVHADEDMMRMLHDDDSKAMEDLQQQYEDEKSDSIKSIMRISTRSAALIASKSLSACQSQVSSSFLTVS